MSIRKKLLLSIFLKLAIRRGFRLLSAVRQMNMQKCFWSKCRDFNGFVYIRVEDSLHVAWDVTTNTDPHTSGLEYKCVSMYAHIKIVTQVMSAGPVVCDVISLSC